MGVTLFYACLTIYLYGDLSIYGTVIGKSTTDIFCTYVPQNISCNDTIPDDELCWESTSIDRHQAYRIFLVIFKCLIIIYISYYNYYGMNAI